MNHSLRNHTGSVSSELSRREMLARLGNGCGLVGLAAVLADEMIAIPQAVVRLKLRRFYKRL